MGNVQACQTFGLRRHAWSGNMMFRSSNEENKRLFLQNLTYEQFNEAKDLYENDEDLKN